MPAVALPKLRYPVAIADDEWVPRADTQAILREADWPVAKSTHKSKEIIDNGIASGARIFVLDIRFRKGEATGIEVAEMLWRQTTEQHLPDPQIIFLTAFGDVDTKSQAEGVSPIAIIEKPASESRILRELDNAAREAAKDDRRREVARLNDERWELLRRKHSGTMLTMEEEKRLKKLEAVIEAFIESEYPLEAAAT